MVRLSSMCCVFRILNECILVEPVFVFAFLQTFIETLQDYLGEISSPTLRDHFDVVYQVSCVYFCYD